KLLTNLIKIYTNNKKYSKKLYDIFNRKLSIFYNYYSKIELFQNQYNKIFFINFTKRINAFYFNKFLKKSFDFTTLVTIIKIYFEIKKNR
ncbi:hypothetical protein BDZ45DRAFT_584238, partial [Acephala macrosclerotiorum]